jgi:hypothetical protein
LVNDLDLSLRPEQQYKGQREVPISARERYIS